MSSIDELYAAGDEILQFATSRGLQLADGDLHALRAAGWNASSTFQGFLRGSRYDRETQSYAFLTEAEFAGPPLHLACLVREFDVGKLAGQLRDFRTHEASASHTLVEYVSTLPWPFQPRWVRALMRFGVDRSNGTLVALGRSVAGAAPPPGATLGTVHYSLYHIRPAASDPGRSVMRRVINVDMHVALPAALLRASLSSHLQGDAQSVARELAGWEGSELQRRLREGECYHAMGRAVQEAAGRAAQ